MILDVWMSRRDGTVEEGCLDGVQLVSWIAANRDEAIRAVPLIAEIGEALQTAKILENVGKAPARVAHCVPATSVVRSTTPTSSRNIFTRTSAHGTSDWSVSIARDLASSAAAAPAWARFVTPSLRRIDET